MAQSYTRHPDVGYVPGAEIGGLETLKKLMVRFSGILTVEKLSL